MKDKMLFHVAVFMPEEVQQQAIKLQKEFDKYEISNHLSDNLTNQNKNSSHDYNENILEAIDAIKKNVQPAFEIEITKFDNAWFVSKYCVRIPLKNKKSDAVVVVKPYYNKQTGEYDQSKNCIKTVWFNSKNDSHATLDTDKYVKKEEWK